MCFCDNKTEPARQFCSDPARHGEDAGINMAADSESRVIGDYGHIRYLWRVRSGGTEEQP